MNFKYYFLYGLAIAIMAIAILAMFNTAVIIAFYENVDSRFPLIVPGVLALLFIWFGYLSTSKPIETGVHKFSLCFNVIVGTYFCGQFLWRVVN